MTHVRLLKAWGYYSKGFTFTAMPANQARTLIARGLAEYVDTEIKASPVNRILTAVLPRKEKRVSNVQS